MSRKLEPMKWSGMVEYLVLVGAFFICMVLCLILMHGIG
jgi:hypothetical protein